MIIVKNGKLTVAGVAFALPEGFALQCYGGEDALTFRAQGGEYIEIGAEDSPAAAEVILTDLLGEDGPYEAASETLRVARAGLDGFAVYACDKEGRERYYEERYPLADGRQLYVIVGETGEALSGKCDELLSRADIQAFFASIV